MMTAFATINEIPALMHATVLLMSPIRDRHIVTVATVRFALTIKSIFWRNRESMLTKVDPSTAPCVTNSGALRIPHKFEGETGNVPTWINQSVSCTVTGRYGALGNDSMSRKRR